MLAVALTTSPAPSSPVIVLVVVFTWLLCLIPVQVTSQAELLEQLLPILPVLHEPAVQVPGTVVIVVSAPQNWASNWH